MRAFPPLFLYILYIQKIHSENMFGKYVRKIEENAEILLHMVGKCSNMNKKTCSIARSRQ